MWHITISKDHLIHIMLLDEVNQILLRMDWDSTWVNVTSQFGRIEPSLDIRDLSCGKCHDFVISIATEEHVEVMKVASRRAHDDGFDWHVFISYLISKVVRSEERRVGKECR